ncbi:MAG: AAA family ATPase [Deltaproteobacteria bacterium]|nr:AAA family ATPase [Deltaproteobacteria bacterium]
MEDATDLNRQFIREVSLVREKEVDWNSYPFSVPVIRNLSALQLHQHVTFFVGENGSGKSTLLEAIACVSGFNAEGGTKNFKFSTTNENGELTTALKITRGVRRPTDGFFYRADSFFNVVSEIDRLGVGHAYGECSLHARSHGEGFLDLVMNRLKGNGLYLFDEPEAALSPKRQLSLLSIIHSLVRKGSQLIIATHSPIIMSYPDAQIYSFTDGNIGPISYEETEHFQVTDSFLKRRERTLRELMEE